MYDDIENRIAKILNKIKDAKEVAFGLETDLFSIGVLDSFGMIEYLGALEKEFNIKILNEDLIPQNLWNLKASAQLVRKYLAQLPSSS